MGLTQKIAPQGSSRTEIPFGTNSQDDHQAADSNRTSLNVRAFSRIDTLLFIGYHGRP